MVTPLSRLSQLERTILAYRQALLKADNAALAQLQTAYAPSRERLLAEIEQTVAKMTADGITTSEAAQLGRARELLRLVEVETMQLAKVTGRLVPSVQQAVIDQALERARMLTIAQGIDIRQASRLSARWTALNTDAVADLVGALGDGSPLDQLLIDIVPDSKQIFYDTLVDGVARGIGPEALGRALAQATELPLHRAMTISRTETMRAYRSASLRSMAANSDILSGWQWSCAPSGACLACQGKDGHVYPLTMQFFPSHVRCRCSPLPVLKDDAMLPRLETQSERFYALPIDEQLKQIPLGARGDFEAGRLRLEDFIHEDHDETWGTSVRQASITQARANAARRRSGGSRLAAGGR
jgi:hypothetical protein